MRRVGGHAVWAAVLAGTALVQPRDATACTCVPEPRSAQYARATDVFVAEVVGGPKAFPGSQGGEEPTVAGGATTRQVVFELEVEQVLKGAVTQGRVMVSTPSDAAACGVVFAEGTTYLVFARRDASKAASADEAAKDPLLTDLCMGNASGDQLAAAVDEVRRLSERKVVPSESP